VEPLRHRRLHRHARLPPHRRRRAQRPSPRPPAAGGTPHRTRGRRQRSTVPDRDHIVCLRNDRRLGIHNGARATITHVDPDRRSITIHTGERDVVLPARYLDGGHLAHGYATTIHKAQGATVDHALLLGSDELTRESGYVALSRGRHTNRIYITGDRDPGIDLSDGPPEPGPNPTNILRLRLGLQRSTAKQLAIDTGQPQPSAPMPRKAVEPPSIEWDITDDLF
jgi:hypothetical protein